MSQYNTPVSIPVLTIFVLSSFTQSPDRTFSTFLI